MLKVSAADIGLFLLRLTLGGIFVGHGVLKLFPENGGIDGFAGYLSSIGVPGPAYPMAIAAVATEVGGGALLILGIFPRLAGAGLAVTMLVAILFVHWKNGFFMARSATEGGGVANGFEYALALFTMSLHILLAGGGKLSLLRAKGKS